MSDTPERAVTFLLTFLTTLAKRDLPLISLRHKPIDAYHAFEGDYDFITDSKKLNDILGIFHELATSHTIHYSINRTKYGKTKLWLYDTSKRYITLEIWTHLEIKEQAMLRSIFFDDLLPFIHDNRHFNSEFEALYYLSHLKTKKKNLATAEIQNRLQHYEALIREHQEIAPLYATLLQEPNARDRVGSEANLLLHRWGVLHRKTGAMKSKETTQRFFTALRRFKVQWLRALPFIPVVGADGVGKTSLIKGLQKQSQSNVRSFRFKTLFRHNILYQLSRPILKRRLSEPMEKNQYDDYFGSYMIFFALIKYPFALASAFVQCRFYLSDRYFHDLILQDTRFKEKKAHLRQNWRSLLAKIPKNYWFIHLDAPTPLILSRKDELNTEAINAYRHDIFVMYLEKPSCLYTYINTSRPQEECLEILLQNARLQGIKT